MQARHYSNQARLDELLTRLASINDIRAKSDLWKLYNNTRLIWTELDKEMVTCRRRTTVTPKYTELEAQYLESINVFEQWAVMATLMYA